MVQARLAPRSGLVVELHLLQTLSGKGFWVDGPPVQGAGGEKKARRTKVRRKTGAPRIKNHGRPGNRRAACGTPDGTEPSSYLHGLSALP